MTSLKGISILTLTAALGLAGGMAVRAGGPAFAAQQDRGMFAGQPSRNMVSSDADVCGPGSRGRQGLRGHQQRRAA